MGSHVLKVLRQGVWGSMTGGWYYEPRHSKFTNVFHLYAWLVLLCLPFTFYLAFDPSWAVVGSYVAAIVTIFLAIKITNYRLHAMFDDGEIVNRKEVAVDGPASASDHVVEERSGNNTMMDRDHPSVAVIDAFPVAGSGDLLRMRENDEMRDDESQLREVKVDDGQKGDHPGEAVTKKRDLEVDVHQDSMNLDLTGMPAKDRSKAVMKKRPRRRRKRVTKTVAFVDSALATGKTINIGRCASLSSAPSDVDNTDEGPSSETDSSLSTNSNDIKSSDEGEDDTRDGLGFRSTTRPIQRRVGVRGPTKHPWYQKEGPNYKTSLEEYESEKEVCSSGDGNDGEMCSKNNNEYRDELSAGDGAKSKIRPRKKRRSTDRPLTAPQHKIFTREYGSGDGSSSTEYMKMADQYPEGSSSPKDKEYLNSAENDGEKDPPTSDQELIVRDPVWRARTSARYSSDRRLLFRRRSYVINSIRSHAGRSDRRRRCLSTVPPYGTRRHSPTRVNPSSLQKLWNMWARDPAPSWTHDGDASSPGQVSPGQVVLTSHTTDLGEKIDDVPTASDPQKIQETPSLVEERMMREYLAAAGDASRASPGAVQHKSETSSHNSNPHCNEVTLSASQAGGDNQLTASPAGRLSNHGTPTERRHKKARRKHASSNAKLKDESLGENRPNKDIKTGFAYDAVSRGGGGDLSSTRSPGLVVRKRYDDNGDSEEDMDKFISNILGAASTWQGTGDGASSSSKTGAGPGATDPETGVLKQQPSANMKRKLADDPVTRSRNEVTVQRSATNVAPELYPSYSQGSHLIARPRRSLPILTLPSTTSAGGQVSNLYQRRRRPRLASRSSAPGTVPSSGGSRRVRHPAGNGNASSHSRLASNTSEEGGAVATTTTLQQLSANSLTSTTELLSNNFEDQLPLAVIEKLEEAEEAAGIHIATEHDDTTAGAIHAFQDEHGNWLTYTFGEGSQVATTLGTGNQNLQRSSRLRSRTLSWQSGDTSDSAKSPPTSRRSRNRRRLPLQIARRLNSQMQARIELPSFNEGSDGSGSFTQAESPDISPLDFILNCGATAPRRPLTPRVKLYYKFKFFPCKSIILQYDRLALHDLLDRNRKLLENVFATAMAVIVAILGFLLLWRGFFLDVWPLWFCAVIASCQYSLVRSIQPDSASPMHGHNRIIAYSRPIYFTVLALLILLFDFLASSAVAVPDIYLYAGLYFTQASCALARNVLIVLIMLLPFIFLLGLLPQINTFITYTAEQFDIHMFGGTACSGLGPSLFSLGRSLVACGLLFGFCYGGMKTEEDSRHILFSVFCGLLVSISYHLSRQTTSPVHLWRIVKSKLFPSETPPPENANAESGNDQNGDAKEENPDDLSSVYVQRTLTERLQSDLIVCPLLAIFMFAIHCSTAFKALQPALSLVLYILAGVLGFLTHYVLPQLRKQLPWLLFSSPILKMKEYHLFEVSEEAQVTWFEKVYIWLCYAEKNILYPVIVMNELTRDAQAVTDLYGLVWGCVILTFVGLKLLRSSYNVTLLQFAMLAFSALFTKYDARGLDDPNVTTYFLVSILFIKLQDLTQKLQFILVYVAPWQITWGSAFHAFAQPFSVPHSGMLLLHTVVSSLFHAPLAPFLGSAVFMTSYVRPIKFWERDYNTKRVDHSNTRLASQIDRGPSSDDNNLNSIFYEHLTLSLQKSLCGDIAMGRWGNVYAGDCFIMASDYLNALVHVIQRGNGVITFQLRGLEFSGTYCQQREVEAISEGVDDNYGFCCFRPGRMKNMLSFNAAFNHRWLAWQVQATKYVLDGYSITDNSATSMLGVYDLRKILISYMVKSVIYFLISHESLEKWMAEETVTEATKLCEAPDYVDIDPSFSVTIHDDYDMWLSGISRTKFLAIYGEWIQHCSSRREKPLDGDKESQLVSLCYLISVLSRRALGTASSHLTANHVVLESFLYGLHSLFKGDFRITSPKDEWVFTDMDLLHHVVSPGVRMSLKLHQDHFQNADDEENLQALYDVITGYVGNMVITHEADPQWRKAVLSNRNSLLALRHVAGDAVDSYFVITLKRRSLGFRVVRVNKECVKGLWAGQQQELVFLRNRNPERGSIQNAKQVLRNMINSSCDQPIGYPIYVSPVTTSFTNTHPQYKKIVGGSITLHSIRRFLSTLWTCVQQSCGGGCNSGGSAGINVAPQNVTRSFSQPPAPAVARQPSTVAIPPRQSTRSSLARSSQSGSNQSNIAAVPVSLASANQAEQVTVAKMIQARQSSVNDNRRHTRSNTEDMGQMNIFRSAPDGSFVRLKAMHGSQAVSLEMTAINARKSLAPLGKSSRNSRQEAIDIPASSDTMILKSSRTSLPIDVTSGQLSNRGSSASGSGRKMHKSASALVAPSSSSSSMSRGDSVTAFSASMAPPAKAVKKLSGSNESDKAARREGKASESATVKHETPEDPNQSTTKQDKEMVTITDVSRVFQTLDVHRRPDLVKWPNDDWRKRGGRSKWDGWMPKTGIVGEVVFRWYPSHRDIAKRSHVGETIVLICVDNPNSRKKPYYVPVPESCVAPTSDTGLETTQL